MNEKIVIITCLVNCVCIALLINNSRRAKKINQNDLLKNINYIIMLNVFNFFIYLLLIMVAFSIVYIVNIFYGKTLATISGILFWSVFIK